MRTVRACQLFNHLTVMQRTIYWNLKFNPSDIDGFTCLNQLRDDILKSVTCNGNIL